MIREATPEDVKAIHDLIYELAVYERAPGSVINTPDDLKKHLFEEQICHVYIAEDNSEIVGFALYYVSYSTWRGKCIYLEDLYVKPQHRGSGYGLELFNAVKEVARSGGYKRMDWQVLDWNEPAIAFYKRQEAILDQEWINGRFFFD